jgi:hypothetical protein
VPIAKLNPDPLYNKNGLPTFAATFAGTTDTDQYYLLDFGAGESVVWSNTCKTTVGGIEEISCELQPTLMTTGFDGTSLPNPI